MAKRAEGILDQIRKLVGVDNGPLPKRKKSSKKSGAKKTAKRTKSKKSKKTAGRRASRK